ncbi:MAG: hypothetical protein HY820_06815 [Acidobacteria bacterium]|nr:hypothetical protein [Acidobacteriota bacterium]
MELILIAGATVLFSVSVALITTLLPRSRKAKEKKVSRPSRTDEYQINPESVPEFIPSWRRPE